MLRKFRIFLPALGLVVVTLASAAASNAEAGCHSSRRTPKYSSYHHNHTYHAPTTYVRRIATVAVAPLPPRVDPNLPRVPAGATLTIPGNFLGNVPGSVLMVFNTIKLPVNVVNWSNEGVTIVLPPMAIRDVVKIRLDVIRPDGSLALQQKILVDPPAAVILHPTAPTPALPTGTAFKGNLGGIIAD